MKRIHRKVLPAGQRRRGRRTGATLTEVLMSILVMGIGVLSVISLFPISFLRTLQATNLTHATILRYNAESASVLQGRQLLHDPDDDGDYLEHDNTNYIVDPQGWHVVGATLQNPDTLGNDGGVAPIPPSAAATIERFNGGFAIQQAATSFVTLPDSWVTQIQTVPEAANATTSVDLPDDLDLTGITPATTPSRVVMTDSNGKVSYTRLISSIAAGNVVNWDNNPTFDFDVPPILGTARIETQENRYTWTMTVRNKGDHSDPNPNLWTYIADVDIAVYFRAPLSPLDERVFSANIINGRELAINHTLDGTKPFAKKGGFVFDVDNARWYRMEDVVEWNATQIRVTLDRTPINPDISNVVVPRNVIDVYPIGSK